MCFSHYINFSNVGQTVRFLYSLTAVALTNYVHLFCLRCILFLVTKTVTVRSQMKKQQHQKQQQYNNNNNNNITIITHRTFLNSSYFLLKVDDYIIGFFLIAACALGGCHFCSQLIAFLVVPRWFAHLLSGVVDNTNLWIVCLCVILQSTLVLSNTTNNALWLNDLLF